jgi:DNA-directed RNA polymerase subunit beta
MSDNKNNFYDHKYSNLVSRRDYAKIDIDFEEPDLLAIQKTNYNDHLKDEIESLIKAYFPVKHPKSKYEVQYVSLKLASPVKSEEEARYAGETYERPLYVDLQLVNNETGEVSRAKKGKDGKSDGILFA